MSNDKWMQNPYVFPGVNVSPSLTPIHVKRRSESHSSSHPSQYSSMSSSGNNNPPSGKLSSKRPSTAGTSVYSSSVYASSTISGGSNSSGSGTVTIGPTKIRYPYTVLKRGKKHHAFPTQTVPYPLNYENRILDCDSLFVNTASPSLSPFIDNSNPATHPRRVLDVGCGTGAWCLKAAQYWPNTRFVGLDLVAIQPESYVTCMQRIEGICRRVKEGKGSKANAPKIPTIGLPRKSTSSSNTTSTTQLKPLSSTTSFGSAPFSSSSSLSGHTIPKPPVSSTSSTPNTSPITPPSAAHPQPSSATLPPSTSPSSSLPPTSPLNPHPRSQQRQTSQLLASSHDRVNWVHHNFLSKAGLPFRNEEFDLIRVCGIAHGVPEDSWDFLLGELTRVLSIGGTLEMIEEDILFPVVLAPKITVGGAKTATARGGLVTSPASASSASPAAPTLTSAAAAIAHQQALSSSRAHQKSLKSAYQNALSSLNELNRQTLIYSEENRPSAFISSSTSASSPSVEMGGSPTSYVGGGYYPHSPITPIEGGSGASIYDGMSPGSLSVLAGGNGGNGGGSGGGGGLMGPYGIPASYLQYVQTVPALAHSLPPLALVNPFRHQGNSVHQGGALAGSGNGGPGKGLTPFAQDHAVLEKLYTSVYTRRWINTRPTKILANALGMQVELGGVVSSECVEIAKPVGRAAFLGVVVDDVDEEDEEVESGNGTSETESCEDENRLETHALGQRRGRRGSGGSRTLLDEGQDEEDGEEGEEDEEEEDVERPLSPPLTPTAASPEGNLLTAPDSAGGAPRIRGAYPPQMRRRKRGRSSGAARQTLEGTTGKSKAHMEGGEEKATSTTTTAAVEEVDDAKSRARVDASTSSIRSKSVLRRATRAAKTASILSTADFKKYPSLVLTTSLQAMFPNLNTEIAKTMHLQRVWENVVACKEAMWEEFLHDSAQREREAAAAAQAQSSTSSSSQSGHSSGSGKFIGALSSGIGGMGGMGAMGVMGGLGSLPIPSPFLASRRVATLLDELEWADSDMRRSERERFDILLDRYEMRIRRHCARAYENSGIPCLVARDRQGWANAEAGLDSSDDEMYDDPVPPSPAPPLPRQGGSGTTPPSASTSSSSGSTPPNSQRDYLESSSSAALAASLASRDGSHGRSYDDPSSSSHGREEHSSSDEITLAEPQSPRSRLATGKGRAGGMSSSVSPVSPVAPPFGRDNFSPSSMSSSISPTGTLSTRMQSSYFGGSSASGSTEGMSVPSTSSPIDLSREREKRRMRSTSIRKRLEEDKDDDLLGPEKLPSRIIKAFIATKTQPT